MTTETASQPVPERPTRTRRFGVADWMLLIAAIALAIAGGGRPVRSLVEQGVGLCRTLADHGNPLYATRPEIWWRYVASYWSTMLWYGFQVIEVLVLSLTPSVLLARLVPPRPPVRSILKQPGAVAGLAVVFGYIWVRGWMHRLFFGGIDMHCGTAVAVGGAVAVAWALLALGRRWEPERSWIDRVGRLIGVSAIAAGLLAFTLFGI